MRDSVPQLIHTQPMLECDNVPVEMYLVSGGHGIANDKYAKRQVGNGR